MDQDDYLQQEVCYNHTECRKGIKLNKLRPNSHRFVVVLRNETGA